MQWASSQAAEERGERLLWLSLWGLPQFPKELDPFRADSPWLASESGCDNIWARIWAIAECPVSGLWVLSRSLATFCMKILSWLTTSWEIVIDALLTPSNCGMFAYCFENNSSFLRFPQQKTQIWSNDAVALYSQQAPQDLRSRYLEKLPDLLKVEAGLNGQCWLPTEN